MASWPDGDGAGMCTGSCWPVVSVSAQVVDVSSRGGRGSLGSGRSAGCAIGEGRTSPRLGAMAGIRSRPYPGRAPALAWLPGPSTTRERSARRVFTRSDRNLRAASGACEGVRVRARLGSLTAKSSCDAWFIRPPPLLPRNAGARLCVLAHGCCAFRARPSAGISDIAPRFECCT